MTDERALAFLHELERADEAAAAVLADLDELARDVDSVRRRAVELEALEIRLPAERERAHAAVASAERELEGQRRALVAAETELREMESGGDAAGRSAARRAATRARDRASVTERRLAAALTEAGRLGSEAERAAREETDVCERARELARTLAERPGLAEQVGGSPAPGLAGAAEWASGARAALFVARGALAREREELIRQANELGALVLGEPLTASSAALVARRVERLRTNP